MKDNKCFKCDGTGKTSNVPVLGCRYCGGTGKSVYTQIKKKLSSWHPTRLDYSEKLKKLKQRRDPDNIEKEGYGMGDMSKDPKRAFKGARWTVRYEHSIKKSYLKFLIKEIIREIIKNEKVIY